MTREDYEKVISTYLLELHGTVSALSDEQISASNNLLLSMEEIRGHLKDSSVTNADLIGFCFGILDEYIHAFWKENISMGYDLYRDMYKQNS